MGYECFTSPIKVTFSVIIVAISDIIVAVPDIIVGFSDNCRGLAICNRELKQTRTATAVNKQLNFTVKNKPHTTNYIYFIFEAFYD